MYEFNDDGPVFGPNGEWELDPDLPSYQCAGNTRPVFATCKNNCPGGELCYQLSVLSYFVIIKLKTATDKLNVSFEKICFPPPKNYCEIMIILFSVNFPVVGGGCALLATTGNVLAGLGGPAAAFGSCYTDRSSLSCYGVHATRCCRGSGNTW